MESPSTSNNNVVDNDDSKNDNNNIVSSSDYQAAISAIEETFQHYLENFKNLNIQEEQQENEEDNGNKSDSIISKEKQKDLMKSLLEESKESLLQNLDRVVQVVSDQDYFQATRPPLVYQAQPPNDDACNQENDEYDFDEENSLLADDDEENEEDGNDQNKNNISHDDEDWDEDELLDPEALKRAQELRHVVRVTAKRLETLRQSVTQAAIQAAQHEARQQVEQQQQQQHDLNPKEMESILNQLNNAPQHEEQLDQDWEAMLQQLSKLEASLPQAVNSLKSTIKAVDCGLEQEQSLSQVEQAIRQEDDEEDANEQQSAQERWVSFMSRYAP